MTADIESLVLEHLGAIRATQAEHSERLDRMDLRLSAIETDDRQSVRTVGQ